MRKAPLEVASTFQRVYGAPKLGFEHGLRQMAAERSADILADQVLFALWYC